MQEKKGFHILAELYGCPREMTEKIGPLRNVMLRAAEKSGFVVVGDIFHQFSPFGATGVILISTSHISAHTWPEHDFVAMDIYSCDGKKKAKLAFVYCKKMLKPTKIKVKEVERFR